MIRKQFLSICYNVFVSSGYHYFARIFCFSCILHHSHHHYHLHMLFIFILRLLLICWKIHFSSYIVCVCVSVCGISISHRDNSTSILKASDETKKFQLTDCYAFIMFFIRFWNYLSSIILCFADDYLMSFYIPNSTIAFWRIYILVVFILYIQSICLICVCMCVCVHIKMKRNG